MRKNKSLGIAILLAITMILFASNSAAIGISPGKKVLDFEPKLRQEIKLTITNPDHRNFRAAILATGEIGKYIELAQNSIEFASTEGEKAVSYEILLPEQFSEPGIHSGEVIIREIPLSTDQEEIVVGALVSVVHQIQVRVPYPGKYAESEFEIVSGNKDELVKFFLRVSNLGQEDIKSAKAFIYIYDSNNNLVNVIKTDEKDIKTTQHKELLGQWNANVSLGQYKATAILDYDGVIKTYESVFTIGDFFIRPIDISIGKYKLGDIAKFNILVENIANEDVNGLVARMVLEGDEEKVIADLKSAPETVLNHSRKELNVFWYTEGINIGTYSGKLILDYGGKSLERKIKVIVNKDSIQAEIVGVTGLVINQPTQIEGRKVPWTAIAIVVLVLSNIAVVAYFKKFKKPQ